MTPRRTILACAAALTVGIGSAPGAATQVTPPRFDAASIKPCRPDDQIPGPGRGTAGGTNASFSPGRFNVPCVTAEQLIYLAYAGSGARADERLVNDGPGERKVRGGPAWVYSYRDTFAIEATAPATVSDRTILMGAMLRTLLEERFKLKLHRDSEPQDMFALTVSKSGLKLRPMEPGDCDDDQTAPAATNPDKPRCGGINTAANGPNTMWTFVKMPVSALAARLSSTLSRHVIDQTGLTREFIIRLEFHPDDLTPGIKWPPERDADTSVPQAAPIFTALEQQLGLRIERTRGPRGFLVIDHIERPVPDAPALVVDPHPPARR